MGAEVSGYGISARAEPKLRVRSGAAERLKAKLRPVFRWGGGTTLTRTIEKPTPVLQGWGELLVDSKRELAAAGSDRASGGLEGGHEAPAWPTRDTGIL